MTTVQLVEIRDRVGFIQKDDEAPVPMTWGELHEAQRQTPPAGPVYAWLMHEYCRCGYEQRQGRAWASPQREIGEIVREAEVAEQGARMRAAKRRAEEQRRETERVRALVGNGPEARVAISGYHNGQMQSPVVLARWSGRSVVRVALSWFDASDRTESTPRTFRGTVPEAERWLSGQGVRLDAQGIH